MEPVFQSARLLQVPKVWNSIRYAISSDWQAITFVIVNLLSTAAHFAALLLLDIFLFVFGSNIPRHFSVHKTARNRIEFTDVFMV